MAESNETPADRDYGYSGRGVQEGNYSGAYGRGTAGETDTPSSSSELGAGYTAGGTDLPTPDREGAPVETDVETDVDARDDPARGV